MRRVSAIAALLALPVMSVFSDAAADANAAVCAQTYGKSDGLACNYATYEQCRAAVSGIAGSCMTTREPVRHPRGRESEPDSSLPVHWICRKNLQGNGCFDCDKVITVRRFSPALSQHADSIHVECHHPDRRH